MSRRKKIEYTLVAALIVALAALFLFFVTGPHNAFGSNGHEFDNVPGHECEQGQHTNNPHCNDATPTPTPTPKECKDWGWVKKECLPSVSPSPEVTATPTAEPTYPQTGTDPNSCTVVDCNTHKNDKPVTPTPNYPTCDQPRTCGFK